MLDLRDGRWVSASFYVKILFFRKATQEKLPGDLSIREGSGANKNRALGAAKSACYHRPVASQKYDKYWSMRACHLDTLAKG